MTSPTPPTASLQRTSRDAATMAGALAAWLSDQLPAEAEPEVVLTGASGADAANGLSSETILADVTWADAGTRRTDALVMRMAPAAADVPVFQSYRMDHQYDVIRLVGELSDVPVPAPRWLEPTGTVLGAPFFFMERVEGIVPPDVMPYTFGDNWFFDADPADQRRLQDATVRAIAGLHQIPDAERVFGFLDDHDHPGPTPLRRHFERIRAWYEWAAAEIGRSGLIDRALAWLDSHWPDADVPDNVVLSWGDARIGNVLYRDFEPVAVLDWEMAAIGPRELDLGWLVFAHEVFQSLANVFEMPGLPDVLREDDVRTTYADLTGAEVRDLTWFRILSSVIWGVVFMRTGARQVHFGEVEMPDEVEAFFHIRDLMTRLLDEVGA